MKVKIPTFTEVNVTHVHVVLPVRYEDEDIPYDAPLRKGDTWEATIEIDTGRIKGWPEGQSLDLYMKVTDGGKYRLLDETGKCVASLEGEYVPNKLIPGDYGDYVDLQINPDGRISNWSSMPNACEFFA